MKTVDYYNTNVTNLVARYDNADMSQLHQLLLKYIPKNSTVLDIGFGSGRDLDFLQNNGYDIWGIDPSTKFLENAKNRFPTEQNQFFEASVPFDKKEVGLDKGFDAVITIAMWMHLQHKQYKNAVESIVSVLNSSSTVIISYSEGSRVGDERYLVEVDLKYLVELFKERNFALVDTIKHDDSLDRDSLIWVTVTFNR